MQVWRFGTIFAAGAVVGAVVMWITANDDHEGPTEVPMAHTLSATSDGLDSIRVDNAARSPSGVESVEVQANNSPFQLAASIFALASDADEAELLRLLDEVAEPRPVSFMKSATGTLYQRYAELNPSAAFDHVLSRRHLFEDEWVSLIFQSREESAIFLYDGFHHYLFLQ